MSYFSAKFRVCWFIHLKFLVIFMRNSFHSLIQKPLVQILVNPGAHVKHFLMLHPAAKFQVSRFIHSRVLALFKKKKCKSPSGPQSKFWKTLGHVSKTFAYFTSPQNFRSFDSSIPKFQPHLRKTVFKTPSGPSSKFWKTLGHVSKIFACFTSLQNFRSLDSSIPKFQPYLGKTVFKTPSGLSSKFWKTLGQCQIHPLQISSRIQETQFLRPHQYPGPNF